MKNQTRKTDGARIEAYLNASPVGGARTWSAVVYRDDDPDQPRFSPMNAYSATEALDRAEAAL